MKNPKSFLKWATSWENLFLPYANNKGADQPAHPCSLISAFVIRSLDSRIPLVSVSKISSLLLVCISEQAGLRLTRSEIPKTGFLVTWLKWTVPGVQDEENYKFITELTTMPKKIPVRLLIHTICPHEEAFDPWLQYECKEKHQSSQMSRLSLVFSLGMCPFLGFTYWWTWFIIWRRVGEYNNIMH